MSIPVTRPTLRRRDLNSVLSCLVSDRIGPGELSAELAGGLSRQLGTSGGVCLSSYSAAIERALDVLEIGPGDSLAMSALTPAIYREVCSRRGVYPALVDVEAGSTLLDVAAVDALLGAGADAGDRDEDPGSGPPGARPSGRGRPKALILHYTLGFLPEADDVLRLGIPVVEDLSHALGGSWNGGPCGSHGQLAVLSLQPEGVITTGEGAAVFARERRTARTLTTIRGRWDEDQILPNMNAALGLAQLRELERFLRSRREIASAYLQAVTRSPHGALAAGPQAALADPSPAAGDPGQAAGVSYGFAVTVRGGMKEARQYAARRGVETRRAFADTVLALREAWDAASWGRDPPAEEGGEQPGQGSQTAETADPPGADVPGGFPRAYELLLRSLQFPLYPALAKKEVQLITKILATLP